MAISQKMPSDPGSLPDKVHELRRLGTSVLGHAWQYRLAQHQKVGLKTVSRWAQGERQVPDRIIHILKRDLDILLKSKFHALMRELGAEIASNRIPAHIAAGQLLDLAEAIKPYRTVPADKKYRNKRKPKHDDAGLAPPSEVDPSIPT